MRGREREVGPRCQRQRINVVDTYPRGNQGETELRKMDRPWKQPVDLVQDNGFQAKVKTRKQKKCKKKPISLRCLRFTMGYCLTFFQSFRKLVIPLSVSGWLSSRSRVEKGTVAISAPISADCTKCSGWRIEATMTSVCMS